MLEIIGEQQHLLTLEIAEQLCFGIGPRGTLKGKAQRIDEQRHDKASGDDAGQGHELHAISEGSWQVRGSLNREAGLADAARANQRQQAALWIDQELAEFLHFALTAD